MIPRLFTEISEHIHFLLSVFLFLHFLLLLLSISVFLLFSFFFFLHFFSCRFRAVD